MGLLNLFRKKDSPAETARPKPPVDDDTLELYANMQVEVTDKKGRLLFVARLRNLQPGTADLYQTSQASDLLSTEQPGPDAPKSGADAPKPDDDGFQEFVPDKIVASEPQQPAPEAAELQEEEPEPVPVNIRGYSAIAKKAVYMVGSITPDTKNVWRVQDLAVTSSGNDRAFFRLDIDINAEDFVPGGEKHRCRLLNISVGGARIVSEHVYEEGDKFILTARLMEGCEPLTTFCQVMRILHRGEEGCDCGCRFLDLKETEQDQITQTMFAIQRRQRGVR